MHRPSALLLSSIRRPLGLGLASVALAVAVGACGDDEPSGDDPKPLSRTAYVEQADAICSRGTPPQIKQTPELEGQAPQLEKDIEYREGVLADLEKLQPPDEIREQVDRYLSGNRDLIGALREQAAAAKEGDLNAFQRVDVDASLADATRGKASAEIGFKKCAQPVEGPPLTSEGFTDPELIKQADDACRAGTEVIVANEPENPDDLRELGEINAENVPPQQDALEKIRALEPPAEDRETWEEFVSVFEERVGNAERLAKTGRANDAKAFEKVALEDQEAYAKENGLASKLGLEVCGQASPLGM